MGKLNKGEVVWLIFLRWEISEKIMIWLKKIWRAFNRSTYSLWELGINIIPIKHLCDFADYFNYTIDYVLGLTNSKNKVNIIKGFNLKSLGKNMKEIRTKHKLSQENIANLLGITQACVARYENGLIEISTSNLYKFSKYFKVSLSKLCNKINE